MQNFLRSEKTVPVTLGLIFNVPRLRAQNGLAAQFVSACSRFSPQTIRDMKGRSLSVTGPSRCSAHYRVRDAACGLNLYILKKPSIAQFLLSFFWLCSVEKRGNSCEAPLTSCIVTGQFHRHWPGSRNFTHEIKRLICVTVAHHSNTVLVHRDSTQDNGRSSSRTTHQR